MKSTRKIMIPQPFTPGIRTALDKENDSVSTETQRRLYSLCFGDQLLAHRLAAGEQAQTKELRWQRAIYKIERDHN